MTSCGLRTSPPAFSEKFILVWHHMVQGPSSHHGSEADDLAVADMRVRLLAGLKRYLHGKRLNGLLSSEVAISPLHLLGSPGCCPTFVLPASRCEPACWYMHDVLLLLDLVPATLLRIQYKHFPGSEVPHDLQILDVDVLRYRLVPAYVDVALCPDRTTNILDAE